MKRLYTDRSRCETKQRCARARWWGYEAGDAQLGLSPVRKSIHLVLGGAVHKGLETLLKLSQQWLWETPDMTVADMTTVGSVEGVSIARQIEDIAAVAAVKELAEMIEHGLVRVWLAAAGDLLERRPARKAVLARDGEVRLPQGGEFTGGQPAVGFRLQEAEAGLIRK